MVLFGNKVPPFRKKTLSSILDQSFGQDTKGVPNPDHQNMWLVCKIRIKIIILKSIFLKGSTIMLYAEYISL